MANLQDFYGDGFLIVPVYLDGAIHPCGRCAQVDRMQPGSSKRKDVRRFRAERGG